MQMAHPLQHEPQVLSGDIYLSRLQRHYRLIALIFLCLRHAVRAIAMLWPFCLFALIPLVIPVAFDWWAAFFIAPTIGVFLFSVYQGVKRDYALSIAGHLLKGDELYKLLWWGL